MRPPFDRTLRVVMWTDAFLSLAVAVLCLVASPVVAVLGLPRPVLAGFGAASLACAGLLATCGAVTGVLLALRLRGGVVGMPAGMHLPLPAGMHPPFPGDAANHVPAAHGFRQDRTRGGVR
jgi:hypothetical protein